VICKYCKKDNPPGEWFCIEDGMPLYAESISPVLPSARLILPNRTIELEEKEISFGKEDFIEDVPASKIQHISRKLKPQFRIIRENETFFLDDYNSTNGTKVNDIEINPKKGGSGRQELKDGDKILIANILKIEFQYR
jgi:pSer/pThr/pTyr-binding forkhead associated (FHA) protein